jgi:L-methionine (R)-S-oxide reductase
MTESCNLLEKLERLSSALSTWGSLDDRLAALVAQILNAENCDLALLESDRPDKLSYHSFGKASEHSEPEIDHESSFKHVIGSGRSLIVGIKDDYQHAGEAHEPIASNASSLFSPLVINNQVIGVIGVSASVRKPSFDEDDLKLLDTVALLVSKSLQVIKLQNILNSLFAQIALPQSVDKIIEDIVSTDPRPDQMARVVSKAFYREMTRAGLDNAQIVGVASEIISELSKTLRRHSERVQRDFIEDDEYGGTMAIAAPISPYPGVPGYGSRNVSIGVKNSSKSISPG